MPEEPAKDKEYSAIQRSFMDPLLNLGLSKESVEQYWN
jgi:hypothetical protein